MTPVKLKRKAKEVGTYTQPSNNHVTPGKNSSAAKRLRIFEEITSPGDTAATIADSAKIRHIDSTGSSYIIGESESEEEQVNVEQKSFGSWTKFCDAPKVSNNLERVTGASVKSSSEDLLALIEYGVH